MKRVRRRVCDTELRVENLDVESNRVAETDSTEPENAIVTDLKEPEEVTQTDSTEPEKVTMKLLLEAGVHFGHQTKRWHPKMKPFVFTERNGIHIIDLQKTLKRLELAAEFIETISKEGKIEKKDSLMQTQQIPSM